MAGSFLQWNAPAPLSISRTGSSPRSPQLINPRSRRRFRPSAQTPATSVLPPFFPPFLRLSFLECADVFTWIGCRRPGHRFATGLRPSCLRLGGGEVASIKGAGSAMKRRGAFLIMCSLLLGNAAQAYIMLPALPLEEVAAQADLVFKGTAISSKSCNHDGAIGDVETRFRVISVIKGEYSSARLGFVHSDRLPPTPVFDPRLHYHFEIGRTYLVFAKGTGDPRVFQQLWINQTGKMDQGVLLCANDKTVSAPAIKPAFWSELISMLHSGRPNDVIYALWQLDQMTGGPGNGRVRSIYSDFGRQQIWAAAHEFITNPNPEIAKMAIGLIGAHNPYMHTADPGEDLAGISATWPVSLTGFTLTLWDLTPLDKWPGNPGALLYRNELTVVANGRMDNATRALAIRALGLVRDRALETPLARWLTDPAPAVRSAAALLLADYPDLATRDRVMTLARDPEPSVRESTGFLIGYGQQNDKADRS